MNALTTPNKTLFLSYSRKQTAWCDDLYTAIDTYTHFQRWRDNKIPESADWWDSICVNIEGCFAFVAILTPDYLASAYCMGELEYALKLEKPVIVLTLGEVDYPAKLNELRVQFAQVSKLDIPQVINKVLSACTQIMQGYMQDQFSTDIHPRKHLRPRVPTPPTAAQTPEEDTTLSRQIEAMNIHGQIPTRDLMRRFNEVKSSNLRLARDLLEKIKQRPDVPVFFDVEEEDVDLKSAEVRHDEEEKERQRLKKIREEYEHLAHYAPTVNKPAAAKAVRRFFTAYPGYPDTEALRQTYPHSLALMPQPFAWVEISGGSGTMQLDDGSNLTIPTETYWMSKYPITNAQYAKFIEAGGYREQRWWTETGWVSKLKGWAWDSNQVKRIETNTLWTQPNYWQDTQWNNAEQPVVGISWFEAVAFCLWLSETSGENIMLPTEAQWQYAAQGKDGRDYPWGNDWDAARSNTKETGIGKTTPVHQYEGRGDSPFGVVDMAGNVWEWCLTDYDNRTNDVNSATTRRVLRGGSWYNLQDGVRAAFRFNFNPLNRFYLLGFRVVLCFPLLTATDH